MASHLSSGDKLGQHGENVVKYLADAMDQHINFIPAGQKTPSIDGVLQIFDTEHQCSRYINVQIKAGQSHVKNRWGDKGAMLHLRIEDIRDWKTAKYPTIVVWVPGEVDRPEAYWRNAQFAKIGASGVKLKASNKFNKTAFAPLLRMAREHAGILAAPLLLSLPLFRTKVRDVKEVARNFYDGWRQEGARNPLLKNIKVTLKGWRHLTRAELPQSLICHKLSLLPCAKEIVATSRQLRYLRKFTRNGNKVAIVRLTGALKERHRVITVIDVVLEKEFPVGSRRAEYTFLSVYERRHI